MKSTCGRAKRQCSKCQYRYQKTDPKGADAKCPECGFPRPCGKTVAKPGDACRLHGGASLKGEASPSFVTGESSKYARVLNGRVAEKFASAMKLDLLDPQEEVGLLQTRLFEKLESTESSSLWTEAKKLWGNFLAAWNENDPVKIAAFLTDLGKVMERGIEDDGVWRDIYELIDRLNTARSYVASHNERQLKLRIMRGEMMDLEEAAVFAHTMQQELRAALREFVDEQTQNKILRRVHSGIAATYGQPVSGTDSTGGNSAPLRLPG